VDGTWVLADADPVRSLGPALAVARQATGDVRDVNVVVDDRDAAGVLARRAGEFADPPGVWRVEGTELVPADVQPLPAGETLDPRVAPFADVLAAAGADPVVEHGRLIAEVNGLEVARVVVEDGRPHLEVGVGRFDREAHSLLSAGQPMEEMLRAVVELVKRHRTLDADAHPLKLLAPARWLRSRILHDPSLVGADHLAPLAATVEAPDLRTPWPAPASGIDTNGNPLVVVCSTGIDLDLVPSAADARHAAFPHGNARLVLALPPRDVHPVTEALAAALARPAEIVPVP
jgi:hypothetical protein